MLTTADLARGVRYLYEGEPYIVLDVTLQTPSGRGGNTLVKVKARHLLSGRFVTETFKAGVKFDEPDLTFSNVQYLYNEGSEAVFMDQESFEQFNLPLESLGNGAKYLREDLKIRAMYFNGRPVNVEMPQHVELAVSSVEPGTRGNTATGTVMTNAVLENGITIKVPLNVKEGDRVLVTTEDDSFYQRA